MKKPVTFLSFIGVVTITIAAGSLHGHMTLRWGLRPDMKAAADLLERIPDRCGDWQMESSQTMSEGTVKMLRCAGYISRRYVNQESGEGVNVNIVFGLPGPISEHTPEVCVPSRNFMQLGIRERTSIERPKNSTAGAPSDEFWFVDFQNNNVSSQRVRTYWAWSTGDRWSAPDGVKSTFAGSRQLYKIQLSTSAWSGPSVATPDAPDDACGRFLKEFLPVAQRHLVVETAEHIQQTDARD